MKQWIRRTVLVLAGAVVLSVTGCATLGMASPFSSRADDFDDAKTALKEDRYAAAFDYASYAIVRDEKHYPAYRLIVKNYEDGMTAINTEIEELANADPTIETQIRKVEIYGHLADFMSSIDRHGNPAVVTFRKDAVTIPITDRFAARGEVYVAELTYDMVEDVNALIAMAETYADTDRIQTLRVDLNAKALDLTLGEARRIAEAGTIEAYREAIVVAYDAFEFVEDNTEVNQIRRGSAEKAMELSLAWVNRVEP